MAKKASKSNNYFEFKEVAEIYNFREKSLKLLFSENNPTFISDFSGYTPNEIKSELAVQIEEIEKDACLNLLACIEARFRIDYIIRCEKRYKDSISRKFRDYFSDHQYRISLEDGILEEWKNNTKINSSVISNIKGAFKYRHWLAHGRYWTYKSQKYDFYGLYTLAEQVESLPLYN